MGGGVGGDRLDEGFGGGAEWAVAIDSEGCEGEGGGYGSVLGRLGGGTCVSGGAGRGVRSDVRGRFWVCERDVDDKGLQLVGKGEIGDQGGGGHGDFTARVDRLGAKPGLQRGDDKVVSGDVGVGFAGEGVDEVGVGRAGGAAVGAGEEKVRRERLE